MKHLVITGGSGGLGKAIQAAFAGPDWNLASPTHAELDVADPVAVRNFFISRPVDLLICAAGITRDGLLDKTTAEVWDEVLSVNFHGAAQCAAAAIDQGCGHIILISSYSAIDPPAGQVAYASAKAALLGLTRSLAKKHGAAGVRVNAIMPGFMETAMTRSVSTVRKAKILAAHNLGRYNTPSAVAGFIHFLHHHLPYTSGQVFQLDSRSHE